MVGEQLGLVIAYDGCIYNLRELRHSLEAAGYAFFSEPESEVILRAYHRWGDDCAHGIGRR